MSQSLLQTTYINPFIGGGSEPSSNKFWKVVGLVLLAHILIGLIGKYGLPEFKVKKKADITIELSAAPFSTATPTPPQPQQQPQPPKVQEKSPDATQKAPVEKPAPPAAAQASASTDSVQTVDADYKAAYLNNPKPPYPSFAFQNRQEGTVLLRVHVLPSGEVDEVQLARTSGFDALDDSALQTVKKWKFVPAKQDGKIVDQWVKVPIKFGLKSR
jgi:protein TonB